MKYYRISKYDPQYRIEGVYQRDEWTSISDIGGEYDGRVFSEKEYYKVEKNYLDFVLGVWRCQGIDRLTVAELENYKHLPYTNGQQLDVHGGCDFVKGCLREKCWGRLVSTGFVFWAGYDYYIHIGCTLPLDMVEQLARLRDLFVEEEQHWNQFEWDFE